MTGRRISQKVVFIGQGYVGLPLAVRAAEVGYHVVGIDRDEQRVGKLAAGESYVEDVPASRLRTCLEAGRYLATSDYANAVGFDVSVISVPTPLRDGVPDLSYIADAGRQVARYLEPGGTVILESTTYPGTTEDLLRPLLEDVSGLSAPEDFHLGYSPERIDPGNRRWRLENTPKLVSGIDDRSLRRVREFYGRLVDRTVPVSTPRIAELAKLLENTYRHVNIALVNELAMFAGKLGLDVWEAIDAASTKPFGYMRFVPGPGVGGHCLPVDPSYLSWQVRRTLGDSFRFIELANDINEHMPDYVVRRLLTGLNTRRKAVNGSRMLLLGLAYKKNIGDVRGSPAIAVAEALHKLGAHIRAVDPFVEPHQIPAAITMTDLVEDEVTAADAVVVLTDHDVFDYSLVERAAYAFDARRRCRGGRVEAL